MPIDSLAPADQHESSRGTSEHELPAEVQALREKEVELDEDTINETVRDYVESSTLTSVLGDHPKTRILAVLLMDPDRDYDVATIANRADLSKPPVYEHINDLARYDIVNETRKVAKTSMYSINTDNPAVTHLSNLEWELTGWCDR